MSGADAAIPALAFFLAGADGARFCLFHRPQLPPRGAIVYIHPFAEEMNHARRIAAQEARALAALGFGVLQIDLGGCGDSAGEWRDATWSAWQRDVCAAADWLAAHCSPHISLWGVRAGALLALDCCALLRTPPARLLLWQPVLSGRRCLIDFLRLGLGLGRRGAPRFGGTDAMRAALADGATLEIAGYELAPALAAGLDGVDGAALAPPAEVCWLEVASAGVPPAAATLRLMARWRADGVALSATLVDDVHFWSAPGHVARHGIGAALAARLAAGPA